MRLGAQHKKRCFLTVFATLALTVTSLPKAVATTDVSDDYDPAEISQGIHGKWPKHVRALGLSEDKSYIALLLSPPLRNRRWT